jgi:hypothetical protein
MRAQLAIATVHPGMVDAQFCQCLAATLSEHPRSNELHGRGRVIFQHAPAGMLHIARNQAVKAFLAHPLGLSHLLFIDADMTWEPECVWQLFEEAIAHDYPVLGALIAMPGESPDAAPRPVMFDEGMAFVEPRHSVERVYCGGAGFLLIHRAVFDACLARYGWPAPWFEYGTLRGKSVSEDVTFSERLAALGIPIHVDTRIAVGHRKLVTYTYAPSLATA